MEMLKGFSLEYLTNMKKKLDFEKIIEKNRKKLFFSKRNSDFAEAMMEFGALICKPKEPSCNICPINKICKFSNSRKNTKLTDKIKTNKKSYDIFCYLNKNKQIGLTKKNDIGFLKEYSLPIIKEKSKEKINLKIGIFCVITRILFQIKD